MPRPSKNLTPPPSPTKQRSSPSTSVVAGAIVAGVTVLAAVGAHFLFKKKPAVAPQRPSAIRSQRRKVPPRRARSTASGASSVTHRWVLSQHAHVAHRCLPSPTSHAGHHLCQGALEVMKSNQDLNPALQPPSLSFWHPRQGVQAQPATPQANRKQALPCPCSHRKRPLPSHSWCRCRCRCSSNHRHRHRCYCQARA